MQVEEVLLALIVALLGVTGFFGTRQLMGIDNRLEKIEKELKPLTPAIVEIQGKFKDAGHSILFPLAVTPGSPLKLTEYGEQLVKESGFDKLLEKHRDILVELVKVKAPKTNYDIQELSVQVIREVLEDDILKSLKEYAFENGLPLEVIIPPAGIMLRDEVMKDLKF